MNERIARQIEEMKKQTIGVEVEMNNIRRDKAAELAAAFFGTGRFENTASRNGYYTWSAWDADGREWKFQKDVSIAGPDDKKCDRHRAENRKGHSPVKKCQTNTDQGDRDNICDQRRNGTAEHGFHAAAIRHHVCGNVGQILCVKEAHGELAKMLRDPKSGRAGLLIGSNIGFPIIVFRGQKHQNSRHQPQAEQFPQCGPRNCFSSKWL